MIKFLFFFLVAALSARAAPVDEIESLLRYVGALEGASFIRNGDVYSPAAAEAHLRLKWSSQKAEIKTAEDFIRLCSTKSSVSGKAYTIRFSKTREEPAAQVLLDKLAELRGPKQEPAKTPDKSPSPALPSRGG